MDFIFMLTHADRTVDNCLAVLDEIQTLPIAHIGFKDIGIDRPMMRTLVEQIRGLGASSYLEIVNTDSDAILAAAQIGADLGIDHLLGGTEVEAVLERIRGSNTAFYPFVGHPRGHPTQLDGNAALIADQCRHFAEIGCAGADLLAYRATEADPLTLTATARQSLPDHCRLIVAGSIETHSQIEQLAIAGCDAFTVGSAIFDYAFSPDRPDLRSQLQAVLACCHPSGRA